MYEVMYKMLCKKDNDEKEDEISILKAIKITENYYNKVNKKEKELKEKFMFLSGKNEYLATFNKYVGNCLCISDCTYDTKSDELKVEITKSNSNEFNYNISFIMKDDDLIIRNSNYPNNREILEKYADIFIQFI